MLYSPLARRGGGIVFGWRRGALFIEHEAVSANCIVDQVVDDTGKVSVSSPEHSTLQLANSETGIIQDLPERLFASDMTQAFGKVPVAFDWSGAQMAMVSAHKLGGPKGMVLILKREPTSPHNCAGNVKWATFGYRKYHWNGGLWRCGRGLCT